MTPVQCLLAIEIDQQLFPGGTRPDPHLTRQSARYGCVRLCIKPRFGDTAGCLAVRFSLKITRLDKPNVAPSVQNHRFSAEPLRPLFPVSLSGSFPVAVRSVSGRVPDSFGSSPVFFGSARTASMPQPAIRLLTLRRTGSPGSVENHDLAPRPARPPRGTTRKRNGWTSQPWHPHPPHPNVSAELAAP